MLIIPNQEDCDRWCDAIEAATAEDGHPCHINIDVDSTGIFYYRWHPCWDHAPQGVPTPEFYESFHRAFVLCDRLRPEWIEPSPAAQAWLDGHPDHL